jgi:hypothetical protein
MHISPGRVGEADASPPLSVRPGVAVRVAGAVPGYRDAGAWEHRNAPAGWAGCAIFCGEGKSGSSGRWAQG